MITQTNVKLVGVIAEAIHNLREVPSGHLYAHVMGHVSLDAYTGAIDALKRAKLVDETHHLLRWIGPRADAETQGSVNEGPKVG